VTRREKQRRNRGKQGKNRESERFFWSWFVNWIEGERRIQRFLGLKVCVCDDVE